MRPVWTILVALSLSAQDPQFNVRSRLVLVPTMVSDSKGAVIDGLEAADFVVLDNGRPQKVTVDATATGVAPIALVVAVQSSGISAVVLDKVLRIPGMIQPLVTGDRGCVALVSFSERVDWLQECTRDTAALHRAFLKLQPGEDREGRMLDAAKQAIDRLQNRPNTRRVLLLISETRDRNSATTLDEVRIAAQRAEVAVYAATYSAFATAFTSKSSATGKARAPKTPTHRGAETGTINGSEATKGTPSLPSADQRVDLKAAIGELLRGTKARATDVLSEATGGTTFPFTRERTLEEAIQKLGVELHSQYMLSFTPDSSDAGFHRLEVQVKRPGLKVRARAAYWSGQ